MKAWLRQHGRSFALTITRFAHTPLSTVLNIGVVGIALALPLAFYVVLVNVQGVAREHTPAPQLSVFMLLDAQPADVRAIEERLKKLSGVSAQRFVSRDKALEELKARSGLADVIASLPRNPLPDGFVVEARGQDAATQERMRAEMAAWPKVEHVQLDSAWAKRLDAVLALVKLLIVVISTLLAFALVAITFNTIRLQILTQRAEIEIAKLIGATDPFVRRPFIYYGTLLGLAGALTAWALVSGWVWLANGRLLEITQTYGGSYALRPLALVEGAAVCALAAGLGWLGAHLSASRNLAEFDPA